MTNNAVRQPDERQRAMRAVELRVQGQTYVQIALALDYSDESGARHAVSRLLARREAESIDELRAVHSARLEGVLSSFWPAATAGDTDAARIVLRTLDSLAKLYGLDAPARVAVGATVTDTAGFANEAARLIERIASMGGTDDLLRSLPNGAGYAVIAERMQTALPVGDDAAAQHVSFDRVEFEDDGAEPWSNIGGLDAEPVTVAEVEPRVTKAEPLAVAEADPLPVAEVEPDDAEAEAEVRPLAPTGNPWARRLGDRYDPLSGWRR
ncbi:hypothetical protein [Mycobacterium sp. URHB0021]